MGMQSGSVANRKNPDAGGFGLPPPWYATPPAAREGSDAHPRWSPASSAAPAPSTRDVASGGLSGGDGARSLERFVAECGLLMSERVKLLRRICAALPGKARSQTRAWSSRKVPLSPTSLWISAAGQPIWRADADEAAGDPAFLSPHRRADDAVSESDHVYALGALLWWLVTERSPGAVGEQAASAQQSARSPFRRELAEIARCAMAADPQARYGTVSEFDAELARWQAKRPVVAVGRRWPYRIRKWLDRQQRSLSVAAVAGGVLVLSALIAGI